MSREPHYPVYYCDLYWPCTYDGKRIINAGGAEHMFRTKPTAEELERWTSGVWESYRAKAIDPGRPVIETRFVRWAPWCLGWFSHWTYDAGQTDAEVLASFGRFVLATEVHNERRRYLGLDEDRCLMGAEDRWRWSGQPKERTPPPCRCDGCKKNGVIRICH